MANWYLIEIIIEFLLILNIYIELFSKTNNMISPTMRFKKAIFREEEKALVVFSICCLIFNEKEQLQTSSRTFQQNLQKGKWIQLVLVFWHDKIGHSEQFFNSDVLVRKNFKISRLKMFAKENFMAYLKKNKKFENSRFFGFFDFPLKNFQSLLILKPCET